MGYRYNPFTSNFDKVDGGSTPANEIETLTGNSGGAVGPDGAANVNILGAGSITVVGNPGTNTLTIDDDGTLADTYTADVGTANPVAGNINLLGDATQGLATSAAVDTVTFTNLDASVTQKGVSELATDAETITGSDSARTVVPSALKAKLGTQTTNAMAYGQSDSSALAWTSGLTDGQIVIGSTLGSPAAATITQGNGITITNSANAIRIDTTVAVATQYDTDSGSATPALHILNVLGGTLLNSAGAGNTVTINADDNVVGSVSADSGSATPTSNAFTIAGGTGCSTSGATSIITVNLDASVPLSFPTDSGTATPAANALTVSGGTGINTSGAAAVVTINLDSPVLVENGGSGRTSSTAYAVICGGTTSTAAHQSIASVGTSGQVLTSNGAGALPTFQDASSGGFTVGTPVSPTSGTTVDFTGLTGATQIIMSVANIQLSSNASLWVRLGDSGGFVTTGYVGQGLYANTGSVGAANLSSSFIVVGNNEAAARNHSGIITLTLIDSTNFLWACSSQMMPSSPDVNYQGSFGAGMVTLNSALTQVQLLSATAATFTGGTVNIQYI